MLADIFQILGSYLKRRVRHMAVTAILLLAGTGLSVLALGMGYWALYLWLQVELGTFAALGILGGASALLALILFAIAFLLANGSRRSALRASEPAALDQPLEIEKAVRRNPRESAILTIILTLVFGWIIGRRMKR